MSQKVGKNNNKVYRLVLTGGPCGGKTTGQARLCTFFENLGWKVYRVPETATVLIGGGVKWSDLDAEQAFSFQENLIRTMMQIEETYFALGASCTRDCLVVCDRGIMDASAYLKPDQWDRMKKKNGWNEVELRDNRYNQVIHMVSAARGAEAFYRTDNHVARNENLELARTLDNFASQAWVGHPYYDVIDNTTDFDTKVTKMIASVCNRLGIDAADRLSEDSKKRKFLVRSLPEELAYPQFQDFIVVHDYLVTPNSKMQARIRRRGQNVPGQKWDLKSAAWTKKSHWTYTHTIRRPAINQESPELKMQISSREYELLIAQKDDKHYTIYKKRRCFLWNNQYFQMDIYQAPCHERCEGLIILETYTTLKGEELSLPDFLDIKGEITKDRGYSMYSLSKKDLTPAEAAHLDKHSQARALAAKNGQVVTDSAPGLPAAVTNGQAQAHEDCADNAATTSPKLVPNGNA